LHCPCHENSGAVPHPDAPRRLCVNVVTHDTHAAKTVRYSVLTKEYAAQRTFFAEYVQAS